MSLTPLVPAFPVPATGDGSASGTVPALGDGAGFLAALTAALGQPEGAPSGRGPGLTVPPKGTGCIADESEPAKDETGAEPPAALPLAVPAAASALPTLPITPLGGGPATAPPASGVALPGVAPLDQRPTATRVPGAVSLVGTVGRADSVVPGVRFTPGTAILVPVPTGDPVSTGAPAAERPVPTGALPTAPLQAATVAPLVPGLAAAATAPTRGGLAAVLPTAPGLTAPPTAAATTDTAITAAGAPITAAGAPITAAGAPITAAGAPITAAGAPITAAATATGTAVLPTGSTPVAPAPAAQTALPQTPATPPLADPAPAAPALAAPAPERSGTEAPVPDVRTADAATVRPADRATEQAAPQQAAPPQAAPPQGAAPAAAPATTAPAGQDRPTVPVPAAHQLAPEVVRLSRSGNGTHRITLTLQPEQLGEVRVTLVVRDGTVRVRLSSEHATETLVQAAPELRRLLEQSGATDARVVVRDGDATATDLSSPDHREARHEGGDRPGADRGRERPGRQADTRPEQPLTHRATAPAADPTTTPTTTTGQLDRLV